MRELMILVFTLVLFYVYRRDHILILNEKEKEDTPGDVQPIITLESIKHFYRLLAYVNDIKLKTFRLCKTFKETYVLYDINENLMLAWDSKVRGWSFHTEEQILKFKHKLEYQFNTIEELIHKFISNVRYLQAEVLEEISEGDIPKYLGKKQSTVAINITEQKMKLISEMVQAENMGQMELADEIHDKIQLIKDIK